jgi:hypothetical protein
MVLTFGGLANIDPLGILKVNNRKAKESSVCKRLFDAIHICHLYISSKAKSRFRLTSYSSYTYVLKYFDKILLLLTGYVRLRHGVIYTNAPASLIAHQTCPLNNFDDVESNPNKKLSNHQTNECSKNDRYDICDPIKMF